MITSATNKATQSSKEDVRRYRVAIFNEDAQESPFIRGRDLIPSHIELIEQSFKVKLHINKADAIVAIHPDVKRTNPQACFIDAAKETVLDLIKSRLDHPELKQETVKGKLDQHKKGEVVSKNLRRRTKEMNRLLDLQEAARETDSLAPQEAKTTPETETTISFDHGSSSVSDFIRVLSKKSGDILNVFHEDPRIKVRLNVIPPKNRDDQAQIVITGSNITPARIELVRNIIESAANTREKNPQTRMTYSWMANIADEIFESTFDTPRTPVKKATEPAKPSDAPKTIAERTVSLRYEDINGYSLEPLAQHLLHPSRSASLSAFSDSGNPLLSGVRVRVDKDSNPLSFVVTAPAQGGIAKKSVLDFVCMALNDAHSIFTKASRLKSDDQHAHVENSALTKAWFKDWIATNVQILETAPEKLAPEFRTATSVITEMHTKAPQGKAGANTPTPITRSFAIAVAPALVGMEKKFLCSVNFQLPSFDDNGVMKMAKPSGEMREIIPTENQMKMIEALMNPNKKIVMVDGPPGTGKSLFAAWAQLKLLQQGLIYRAYYERPLETVAGKNVGFLKGTLDQKVGPHNEALQNVYKQLLGKGDVKAGTEIFNQLEAAEKLLRYDGLFARGDTIYDSFLYIDEAQNKRDPELWNLFTRAEDSKIVVSGDADTQVDIKDSGFGQCWEMYREIEEVEFVHLGEEDIKRSALIQKLYAARKAHKERSDIEKRLKAPSLS